MKQACKWVLIWTKIWNAILEVVWQVGHLNLMLMKIQGKSAIYTISGAMAEANFTSPVTKKYAVVTGANRGIGMEICRQLASNGIFVVFTARNEKRGTEAMERLKKSGGFSENEVEFHQLDVDDSISIASLADYIRSKFGKLDILVNNAGVAGTLIDEEAYAYEKSDQGRYADIEKLSNEIHEVAEQGLKTNYYGVKNVIEALIPLLQLSDSGRIVNVSSIIGQSETTPEEHIQTILNNTDNLTEERIGEFLNKFLEDSKESSHGAKSWPSIVPAYIISNAVLIAYTRVLAKKYPSVVIDFLCPGYVKTDDTSNIGVLSVEDAKNVARLALLAN